MTWHSKTSDSTGRVPIEATEFCVQDDTLVPSQTIAKLPFPFAIFRQWYWSSRLRVLAGELGNLVHRIRWALEIYEWGIGGYRGPVPILLGETPRSECHTCRHAYISSMQRILDSHPSLTIVDSHLMSRAWWDGWGSAHRKGKQQNQQTPCSLCSPMDSDSMPLQAVQQSTKRDPLTPLPSRV
jgi:hypothetical protein